MWPAIPSGADMFEKLAAKEFALATRMDILAARWALAVMAMRNGKTPPASEMKSLARDMRRMSADFERLWMARNRRSRLIDNLNKFRKVEKHCLKAAKK